MGKFHYQAVSRNGQHLSGEIEAASHDAAIARVQDLGHLAIAVDPAGRGLDLSFLKLDLKRSHRPSDIALLTRVIADLVGAGLTVDQALDTAQKTAGTEALRAITADLRQQVRSGTSFGDAIGRHGDAFPAYYSSAIRAAERGGFLDTALRRLADSLLKSSKLRDTVRTALIYPAILLVMAGLSILLILTVVVPRLAPLFDSAGAKLPFAASLMIGISNFLVDYAGLVLVALIAAAFGLRSAVRMPTIVARIHRLTLRLPVFRDVVPAVQTGRFTRILSTLVANGVALPTALSLAGDTLTNAVLKAAVGRATLHLKEGRALHDSLAAEGSFPSAVIQLIRVGEQTGRLAPMLDHGADLIDYELERALQRQIALLVPALTIVLGAVIAGLIATIFSMLVSVNELAF